jgi:predicted Fe-Mo cluster-binding NifX family protein
MKKIAVITDDGQSIGQHFGRAKQYKVFSVDQDEIVEVEYREKPGHHSFRPEHHDQEHHTGAHGTGEQARGRHAMMFSVIDDCEVLIVRGMGRGAYSHAIESGITPIVTDIESIAEAVDASMAGTIINHIDQLH